ncbi:MAG: DsrE/DsrF/DrsH-like family protein [Bacteroidales bacterium]
MVELHPLSINHESENSSIKSQEIVRQVDAKGSLCPGPIMSLQKEISHIQPSERLQIVATDKGFPKDVTSWCEITGHKLISLTNENELITAIIEKISDNDKPIVQIGNEMVIIIFSEEMDKALAAFNIALGAAACGINVSVFFTFYGLSLLRKNNPSGQHTAFENMITHILPKGDKDLPLSHNEFMGLGHKFMTRIMKDKNIPPLDFMIHMAKYDGIKFIACQMSMDMLGIKKEDLMDDIEIGGVATMLERARFANMNFFI